MLTTLHIKNMPCEALEGLSGAAAASGATRVLGNRQDNSLVSNWIIGRFTKEFSLNPDFRMNLVCQATIEHGSNFLRRAIPPAAALP